MPETYKKISELPAATPSGSDLIEIVSVADSTNKKITLSQWAATGPAGPNLVSDDTETDLTGYLVGDGDFVDSVATIPHTDVSGLGTLATQNGTFSGTSSGTNTGDQTSVTGNAGTATALQTARNINGIEFDGTANITVTAAAGTLTGTTLNATVVASSLTSVGTLSAGAVPVSLITGSAGRVPYFGSGGAGTTDAGLTFDGTYKILQISDSIGYLDAGTSLYLRGRNGVVGLSSYSFLAAVVSALGSTFAAISEIYTPLKTQAKSGQTANLFSAVDESDGVLCAINKNGGIVLASMADASAENSSLYYSTTASKPSWKDSGGTVHTLY